MTAAQDNRSSARRRAETHETFERTAWKIPDGSKSLILKPDTIRKIDILNYKVGQGNPFADPGTWHYERTYFVHRGVGPDGKSFICPAKTAKQRCPICDYIKRGSADTATLKALAPRERQLFNVVDLDDRNAGVQVLDMSFFNFGEQLDKEIKNSDGEDGYEFFADLRTGMSLKLGVESKTMGTGKPFAIVKTIGFKARATPYTKDIVGQLHCLDDLLIIHPYEKLQELFFGGMGGGEDYETDGDGFSTPTARTPGKRTPATAPAPATDDGWEDDAPAPAPKPRAAKPAAAPAAEAPADDNWDDAPAPAAKPAAAPKPRAAKPAPAPAPADDGWEDEQVAEAPAPKPRAAKPAAAKPAAAPAPAADDWEDEPAPAAKPAATKPRAAKPAAAPAPAAADDNWEDDWPQE